MARDLEKLALGRGTVWVDWEVVYFVYQEVRDVPMEAAIAQLRAGLSDPALASIQQASRAVVERDPEADSFCGGWITPEAPATLLDAPMEFARFLAVNLVSPSST